MAIPVLAPLAPLVPIAKVLALGSVKFIGVGIGAAVAPVFTANFLVGLSAGTPLKYAQFRHRKGLFTEQQMDTIEAANRLVHSSISDKQEHLSRAEAREFLKEVLLSTLEGMKKGVVSIPKQLVRFGVVVKSIVSKPFSSKENRL